MNMTTRVTGARTVDKLLPRLGLAFGVLALGAGIAALRPASAQEEPTAVELAAVDELADIVGPIALYPDDLVAIVLPASTYPLQVVQAARFLEDQKDDSSVKPDPDWDDSIVALLNYPEVVKLLNDDLDWTYDLGTAVLNQRADVLNAIQSFRDRAYAAGNLRSDDRQTVARDDGAIVIKPADPQVVYVPYYEPERVVVYQTAPVYHYYPHRYPVYYYPYPAHYTFGTGFWGVRSWFSIGWHSHHVHVYDWHYHNHPYYGWNYYDPFYARNVYVNVNVNNHDHVWQPRYRYGGRPTVRGHEGRVYRADTPAPARTGGGMASGAYRNRSVEGSTQARPPENAANRLPRRGVLADANRSAASPGTAAAAPQTESGARGRPQEGSNNAATRTYRSGGGMSQALERQRAQVGELSRGAPASRARQGSTGMPQESSRQMGTRNSPQPAAAPRSREPSGGGMGQAMRGSTGGGSYRGNPGAQSSGGGEPAGRSHPAARGGEGRSAAR